MTRVADPSCIHKCYGQGGGARLRREGNVIKSERYDIIVEKDKVRVYDRETDTWFEAWGDPHIGTSDDGRMLTDFHTGNVTVDLEDGTKITIKPTAVGANGKSWIDSIGVVNGKQGITVENIHGSGALEFGRVANNGSEIDAAFEDGTVLYTAGEADDLYLAATKDEIDAGEYDDIDGLGGMSRYDYTSGVEDSGAMSTSQKVLGRSGMFSSMFKLYETLQAEIKGLEEELNQVIEASELVAGSEDGAVAAPTDALKKLFGEEITSEEVESKRQQIQLAIQQVYQEVQQVIQTVSNLSKTIHDTAMAIIRNTRS